MYDTGESETVYNLRIADNHTYFVGGEDWAFSIWAHNAKYNDHHIMTNKNKISKAAGGPYTPKFQALADQRGITLNDPRNRMMLADHQGPHPDYNKVVYQRLQIATDKLKGAAFDKAFDKALAKIKKQTGTVGTTLNRLATGG